MTGRKGAGGRRNAYTHAIMGLTTILSLHMRVMATHASSFTSELAPRCTAAKRQKTSIQRGAVTAHLEEMQQAPKTTLAYASRGLQSPHAQVSKRGSSGLLILLFIAPAEGNEGLPPLFVHNVPEAAASTARAQRDKHYPHSESSSSPVTAAAIAAGERV